MNIHAVIDRAITDPVFAAQLAAKAGKASRAMSEREGGSLAPPSGEEWEDLLRVFADSPEQLSRLLAVGDTDSPVPTATTSKLMTMTVATTTTLECSVTTTTTTTTTTDADVVE